VESGKECGAQDPLWLRVPAYLDGAQRRGACDGKRRRISIAIPERGLARLKTKAAEKGMPYQTLINSILHEYVEG